MMEIDYFWRMHKKCIFIVCIVCTQTQFLMSFQLSVKLSLSLAASVLSSSKNNIDAVNHMPVAHINNNFFSFKFRFVAQSLSYNVAFADRIQMKCVWLTEQVDNVCIHRGKAYSKEMKSMERKGKGKRKKGLQYILCKSDIQINLIEHPSHKKHNGSSATAAKINLETTTMSASHLVIMSLCAWIWIRFARKR